MNANLIKYALNRRSQLKEDRGVRFAKGFKEDPPATAVPSDINGVSTVDIREMERVIIHLSPPGQNGPGWTAGYHIAGDSLRQLPIGSTFDAKKGIFYWSPGPGFIGEYPLVFVNRVTKEAKEVIVKISAKFPLNPEVKEVQPGNEPGGR
jgi:hypothetical protein